MSLLFDLFSMAHGATDYAIGWNPSSGDDIDGYGIYIQRAFPGPPYEHVGDVFLDEFPNQDAPEFRLIEIEPGTYYVAATAFDKAGNESRFSDSLCVSVSENSVSECSSDKNADNAATYGLGGGGGGCLISCAGKPFGFSKTIWSSVLIGLMLLIMILPSKREVGKLGGDKDEKLGW